MGLMEEIKNDIATRRPASVCRVGTVIAALSTEDRKDLEAALADMTIPATTINRVLLGRGYDLDKDGKNVNKHRSGRCACA